MSPTQYVWAQVYAAVIGGLAANTEVRLDWVQMRERARIEANEAVRKMREDVGAQ